MSATERLPSVRWHSRSKIDKLDILELNAKYADALDFLEPERLTEVFTDDAVWEIVERGHRLVGREEIMRRIGAPMLTRAPI